MLRLLPLQVFVPQVSSLFVRRLAPAGEQQAS
jgi:hypothetical protein